MRFSAFMLALSVLAVSCTSVASTEAVPEPAPPTTTASTMSPTSTTVEYPDLVLRQHRAAMQAVRPVEGSAMPPKHLNAEWFPTTLVDRNEIVSGGPPPDGIPSIDDPRFVPINQIDDLDPHEAVLVLEHGGATKIYPVRIMLWHEIVNDVVDGTPITVAFCPLCNSALAYRRTVDAQVLDFGTSGYLYRSGMVMYDRQTESLWTHFDGRAVVGSAMGTQLERLPIGTVSWSQAIDAHPDAVVLLGDADNPKPYGTNRYVGYDQADGPLRGWFNIDIPEPIPPMTRVVGVRTPDGELAVPTEIVADRGVVDSSIGEQSIVMFFESGTASPIQRSDVAAGDDIGSTGVFDPTVDGRRLNFREASGQLTDSQTGSIWNIRGRAIIGPLVGTELVELEHLDTFWFAWVAHHPETRVIVPAPDPD